MGANGVETIVTGNTRIAVKSPKQFEAFGRAVHHSGCDCVIESDHGTGGDPFQQLIQSQYLWPVGVLYSLSFVVNSGNAQAATTWNVAHLTFSSGGTGIFVPTMLDLTFSFDGQTSTSHATKGSAPSAITCTISATQDGFTLSGVVTGTIVHNG